MDRYSVINVRLSKQLRLVYKPYFYAINVTCKINFNVITKIIGYGGIILEPFMVLGLSKPKKYYFHLLSNWFSAEILLCEIHSGHFVAPQKI